MAVLTRVARGATTTLTHTFYVDELPTNSTTTVTVTAVDAGGATVFSGNAAGTTTGVYTYTMPGQSQLSLLTVSWGATIATAAVTEKDTVEIVGGYYFSLAEARASDPVLADTSKYATADLIAVRTEVEAECEWICDRAFVPRYARVVLDGSGSSELTMPDADVRSIRSASVAPRAGQTFVPLTGTELAALIVRDDQTLKRVDTNIWTEGYRNVIVEYEYGLDAPPPDLARAAKTRLRSRLNFTRSAIPDRAASWTSVDGGTYRLTQPDAFRTGIAEVDAAYSRYSRRVQADAAASAGARYPASRTLNYDPQRNALFHGGRR